MRQDRKARARQLNDDLHKSTAFEALAIKELVGLLFEEAKDALVGADGNELYRLQGEARAMDKLYRNLTRTPITPQQKEQ